MNVLISAKDISMTFDRGTRHETRALEHITFDLYDGEFFACIGQSGSGKSTLLRILAGLEREHRGDVQTPFSLKAGDVGFIFQSFALMPWLTVYENVAIGLLSKPITNREERSRVHHELEKLGLSTFANAYPRELSGGMRQRVGIARALVTNPKIIFMDEPFSELDSFNAAELRSEVLRIWQEQKVTMVMVTHLIPDAVEMADRIGLLHSHPGVLSAIINNPLPRPRPMRTTESFTFQDKLAAEIAQRLPPNSRR